MSKSELTVSDEAQDEADHDSVFDFLYHDSRRIASFLSQFDVNGHLTGLTQGESVTKGSSRSKKIAVGGDVPLLGGGKVEWEVGPGEQGSQTLERIYDPFWTNARQFLDVLTERKLIKSVDQANIGQFVLAKGYLKVLDLAMFKDAWKLPSFQRKIKDGANVRPKSTMTSAQKAEIKEQQANTDLMLEMIQIMPHSVHATLLTSDVDESHMLWCTLKDDYLVTPASDLTLAHGSAMPGEWAVIGILGAKPEYLAPELFDQSEDMEPGLMQSVVGQVSQMIAPVVRVALGRPAVAHAVTPLLIFREVS